MRNCGSRHAIFNSSPCKILNIYVCIVQKDNIWGYIDVFNVKNSYIGSAAITGPLFHKYQYSRTPRT